MIELNYKDPRPVYEQIKESLKKLIISGALKENERLESVRSLAVRLSINPNTIQRAYNELESDGYIYSVPGKGSFVSETSPVDTKRQEELKNRLKETALELEFMGVKKEELIKLIEGEKS